MIAIQPGFTELRRVATIPAGWVEYTGPIVMSPDDDHLFMTPQVAPPYLVEWTAQEKADWTEVHGGDPVLTARRLARDEGVDGGRSLSTAQRAEMAERNKRDNYLVTRIMELQAAMDAIKASTGPVASIRDAIPASWSTTQTRTRADARQDLRDAIDAGDGDN